MLAAGSAVSVSGVGTVNPSSVVTQVLSWTRIASASAPVYRTGFGWG
jgi:hypothetical protein